MTRWSEPFLTESQLADLLQVEPERMARLRREKKLPHTRLSKNRIRYSTAQVEAVLARLEVAPALPPGEQAGVPSIGGRTAASARRKRRAS